MKKILFILSLVLVSVTSCTKHSDKEYDALSEKVSSLTAENEQLQKELAELKEQVLGYKNSPEKSLASAKTLYANEKVDELLKLKEEILKYHPESQAAKEIAEMYSNAKAAYDKKIEDAKKKAIAEKEAEKKKRMQAVNKLKKDFDDVSGTTWYKNPYFTHYNDINSTSIYIGKNESTTWLRLKMSYNGDDWIFFENAYLSYDGSTQEVSFNKYDDKKSDNSGGGVWEWIDVSVDQRTLAFLREMVNGKSVKMRLSGKYTKTKSLSAKEINGIKDVLLAYDVLVKGE